MIELFGTRLKTIRLRKNLNQNQLAKKLDITRSSVSCYERGGIYPSLETLIKICKLFDVSADFLLGLSETEEFKMSHLSDEQVNIILNIINQFEQIDN